MNVQNDFIFDAEIAPKELVVAIEKWNKVIPLQEYDKDYLRLFEEIINKGKHEKKYVRFF